MQTVESDLPTAVALEGKCKHFLKNYRKIGLGGAVATAPEIADDLGIEAEFKEQMQGRKKV